MLLARILLPILIATGLTACSPEHEPGASADVGVAEDGGLSDAGGDLTSHPGIDASGLDVDARPTGFALPATQGSYTVPFSIGIEGRGAGRYGAVTIASGSGSVEIDGEHLPLGVYEQQEWEAFGYTLYQALAVADDALTVLWFYCRDGALTDIWAEGTDGSLLERVPATGTCAESPAASTVNVSFGAVDMPIPPLLDGFTVIGPDVGIEGASPGFLRVGGTELDVYVFSHVDCTVECGEAGWHELHALFWDAERRWLCFGIFYLFLDDRQPQLAYAFSLPSLQAPFGAQTLPDTTWSGP